MKSDSKTPFTMVVFTKISIAYGERSFCIERERTNMQ